MTYTVTTNATEDINLAPQTVIEEVVQNVAMIISTPQFTVPLMREFGLPMRFIDKPIQAARSLLIAEIYDAIEKYEPRAIIQSVSFEEDHEAGKLIPKVEVKINGE